MTDEQVISKLRALAQLDVDAIGTYDAAIAQVSESEVAQQLAGFRVDHVRHVQDLNALIVARGGTAVEQVPDLKGVALTGMTMVTSLIGTEAALMAMIGNEELTNRVYEAALKLKIDSEALDVIRKNYADERRHLEWIKHAFKARLPLIGKRFQTEQHA
jgi:rubrerythrin